MSPTPRSRKSTKPETEDGQKAITPRETQALTQDMAQKSHTTTVGLGLTLKVGEQPLTLQSPDIVDIKNIKLDLVAPASLGTVQEAYTGLQGSAIGQLLPPIDWNNSFAQKIGQIRSTLDELHLDAGTGGLKLGLTFEFQWQFGPITFDSASLVVTRTPTPGEKPVTEG